MKKKKKVSSKKKSTPKKARVKKSAPRKGRIRSKMINKHERQKALRLAQSQVKLIRKAARLKKKVALAQDQKASKMLTIGFPSLPQLPLFEGLKLPPLPRLPDFFGAGVLTPNSKDPLAEKLKKAASLLVEEVVKACKDEATRILPELTQKKTENRIDLTDLGLEIGRAARKLVHDFLAAKEVDESIVYQRLTSKTKLVQLVKKYDKLSAQSVFE